MTGTVARMVLEEHERMDGSGYPQGLAGAAIDPGARVLAVCDSLEAMTHPRPYRDNLSPGEALARVQVLGQYTLDPKVVQALTGELQALFRRSAPESERR
jgi:HD-GYP domain-containing protein (c-di-GMP phosphodiesterase class II)